MKVCDNALIWTAECRRRIRLHGKSPVVKAESLVEKSFAISVYQASQVGVPFGMRQSTTICVGGQSPNKRTWGKARKAG
jgi:hypothetical protein